MRMRAWEGVLARRPYACALTTVSMTLGMAEVDVTVQESVQPKYFIHPTSDCGKRERSIAAWPELVREDPSTMAEDIQS